MKLAILLAPVMAVALLGNMAYAGNMPAKPVQHPTHHTTHPMKQHKSHPAKAHHAKAHHVKHHMVKHPVKHKKA
ncbi:MAG TPA: hypothetical protein PLM98_08970 [Thiolinea sp.]|nr:hypothetical protein [Thiolinea sp.]